VVLDAAVRLLGDRPDASLEQIATEAGVSRQTVYAHFASRAELIESVVTRMSDETVAMLDAAELGSGGATEAMERFLARCWELMRQHPVLLSGALESRSAEQDRDRHASIAGRVEELVRRGQAAGEFDPEVDPAWLTSAVLALGHAAGGAVGAGRMSSGDAAEALRRSVLRLTLVAD